MGNLSSVAPGLILTAITLLSPFYVQGLEEADHPEGWCRLPEK